MDERITELLFNVGLERNTIQVLNGNYNTCCLMFPNFMSQVDAQCDISDKELLDSIQRMMEEHAMEVAKTIKMFKRYRKTYE